MQTEILLSAALRFAQKRHYNLSLTQSLCKTHLFEKQNNVNNLIVIWQQTLSNYNHRDHNILDWLNIILFNICALNQQYIAQCDNRMLESTEEAASLYDRSNKKLLIQSNQTELVRTKLVKWISLILECSLFKKIFSEMTSASIAKDRSTRYLIETIDYLIHKYKISCKYEAKISEIMESIAKSTFNQNNSKIIIDVNKKVFSSGQKFATFMQMVQSNYSIDLQDLAELICINYIQLYPPRPIFNSADQTGKSLTEQLIDFLIRKTTKVELFSEKIQAYRPYQLLMAIIFHKYSASISQWNLYLMENFNELQKTAYTIGNEKIIERFCMFFTVFIPNDHPSLSDLLKYVHSSLLAKYSATDSFQLMKKLILNRLFLNPLYFSELIDPSQDQMSRYVKFVNSLRILFYQKKVLALQDQQNNPRITQISQLLIKSLKTLLNSRQNLQNRISNKDMGIYVNDKILIKLFYRVSEGIAGFSHQSSNKSNKSKQSNQSESQLSFSLKNQSMSRLGISSTNHQLIGNNNNSSFPILPKPQQKIKPSPQKIDNTKNQNSSNASQNYIYNDSSETLEIEGLQSLIALRRQYGELYRQIEARCSQKKQHQNKKIGTLWRLNEGASELREDLVKSINQVLINTQLF